MTWAASASKECGPQGQAWSLARLGAMVQGDQWTGSMVGGHRQGQLLTWWHSDGQTPRVGSASCLQAVDEGPGDALHGWDRGRFGGCPALAAPRHTSRARVVARRAQWPHFLPVTQTLRSAALEDCALCQETLSSSELAAKTRDGDLEGV